MKTLSSAILYQLTTALFDKDLFQVGYLLMALSEIQEGAGALKNKFMAWTSVEALANMPCDSKYDNETNIFCVDGPGAIISFLSTLLDNSLPPVQYVEKLGEAGGFIVKHFGATDNKVMNLDGRDAINQFKCALDSTAACHKINLCKAPACIMLLPSPGINFGAQVWLPKQDGEKYKAAISNNVNFSELLWGVCSIIMADRCQKCGVSATNGKTQDNTTIFPDIVVAGRAGETNKEIREMKRIALTLFDVCLKMGLVPV